jgi:hypothetical protein
VATLTLHCIIFQVKFADNVMQSPFGRENDVSCSKTDFSLSNLFLSHRHFTEDFIVNYVFFLQLQRKFDGLTLISEHPISVIIDVMLPNDQHPRTRTQLKLVNHSPTLLLVVS